MGDVLSTPDTPSSTANSIDAILQKPDSLTAAQSRLLHALTGHLGLPEHADSPLPLPGWAEGLVAASRAGDAQQQRAMAALIQREVQAQRNLEQVTARALAGLTEAHPRECGIEPTWLQQFVDGCRTVRDTDMQDLWARALVEESQNPGRISLATIRTLGALGPPQGRSFAAFCNYLWSVPDGGLCHLKTRETAYLLRDRGLGLDELLRLERLDLIELSADRGFDFVPGATREFGYGRTRYVLACDSSGGGARVAGVFLTPAGAEIAALVPFTPDDRYPQVLIDSLRARGVVSRNDGA
jgi:hypothetical protein